MQLSERIPIRLFHVLFSFYLMLIHGNKKAIKLFSIMGLLIISNNLIVQSSHLTDKSFEDKVKQTLKKNAETLRFMENKGQVANKDVLYYFEGKNGSAFIARNKIRFVAIDDTLITSSLQNENGITRKRQHIKKATHTFTLTIRGANPYPDFELGNSFKTKYNFFLGNEVKDAITEVQAAKDLMIKNVYPGIDLRLYSSECGLLEFDWLLAPGADFRTVKLNFTGQDNLSIDKKGNLIVGLRFTKIHLNIPESYQVSEMGKMPVRFSFNKLDENSIVFASNSKIDPRYGLVIDPILNWGTLMDGGDSNFDEYLSAIQVDSLDGMVYCAGNTNRQIITNSAPYDADGYLNMVSGLTGSTGPSSLPNVAIVYRINSTGTDLVDLTLYGPSTVSGANLVSAYALSLSPTKVLLVELPILIFLLQVRLLIIQRAVKTDM